MEHIKMTHLVAYTTLLSGGPISDLLEPLCRKLTNDYKSRILKIIFCALTSAFMSKNDVVLKSMFSNHRGKLN